MDHTVATGVMHKTFASAVETLRNRFDGWDGRSIGAIAHAAFMYETAARRLWAGDAGPNRAVRWTSDIWVELTDCGTHAVRRVREAAGEADARGDQVAGNALRSCAEQIERAQELVARWAYDGLTAAAHPVLRPCA